MTHSLGIAALVLVPLGLALVSGCESSDGGAASGPGGAAASTGSDSSSSAAAVGGGASTGATAGTGGGTATAASSGSGGGNGNCGYSTSFGSNENPISEGGMWTNGAAVGLDWHDVQSEPGEAHASDFSPGYDDSIAVLNTTLSANQYAQATVFRVAGYSPPVKHEVELLLHFQVTPNFARGYETLWGHDGGICIVRWNGPLNDYTELGCAEGGQAVDGDVLRVEIVNGAITVYKNSASVLTAPSDSTWPDGQPGVGFWPKPGATIASYGWKDFTAGCL